MTAHPAPNLNPKHTIAYLYISLTGLSCDQNLFQSHDRQKTGELCRTTSASSACNFHSKIEDLIPVKTALEIIAKPKIKLVVRF